jgi:hypothetical protein
VKPTKPSSPEASTSDGIFSDFKLFTSPEISDQDIESFKKLGGKCTSDSTSATLVLHSSAEIEGNLDNLRKLYNPQCRHFQISWLRDSVCEEKLKNPGKYFVKLRQV